MSSLSERGSVLRLVERTLLLEGNNGLCHITRTGTGAVADCISRTGTWTAVECVVSADWYWAVVNCIISVGSVLGQ